MVTTLIDTASLHSLTHIFNGDQEEIDTWTLITAHQVSTMLLINDSVALLSSPEPVNSSFGIYGKTEVQLSDRVKRRDNFQPHHQNSLANARRWITKRSDNISSQFEELFNSNKCRAWLENEKKRIWVHHTVTRNGLFNHTFIGQLSSILNISEKEILQLHTKSMKLEFVKGLDDYNDSKDLICILERCYVLSALFRGVYQEYIARSSNCSLFQHPIRRNVDIYPNCISKSNFVYNSDITAAILAGILIQSALRQKEDKLEYFVSIMNQTRIGLSQSGYHLSQKLTLEQAIDDAIRIAKSLNIPTQNQKLYSYIDSILSISVGIATAFTLSPYLGLFTSAVTHIVNKKLEPGKKIGKSMNTEKSYQKMTKVAGRIITKQIEL